MLAEIQTKEWTLDPSDPKGLKKVRLKQPFTRIIADDGQFQDVPFNADGSRPDLTPLLVGAFAPEATEKSTGEQLAELKIAHEKLQAAVLAKTPVTKADVDAAVAVAVDAVAAEVVAKP